MFSKEKEQNPSEKLHDYYLIRLKKPSQEELADVRDQIIKAIEKKRLTKICTAPELTYTVHDTPALRVRTTKPIAVLISRLPKVLKVEPYRCY